MAQGDLSLTADTDQTTRDDSYGFFLYFFDEISGHIPLYAYPTVLLNNEDEKQIISIHSIWWHQDKFLESDKFITIDLELRGFTYCATLILCQTRRTKRRFGMDSTKWQAERFVLIVRAPSAVSFIAQEILYELKTRIQGNIGENLSFLVENHLKMKEKSKVGEFLEKKSKEIEDQLAKLCNTLFPKIPIAKLETQLTDRLQEETIDSKVSESQELEKQVPPKKHKTLRFSIPKEKKIKIQKDKTGVVLAPSPKRVKVVQINRFKEDKKVRITIRNNSPEIITNTLLKIYESQGFFGKDVFVSRINKWAPKEDVSIEFEPINESGIIYFLKVEDEKETIKVKRILG